MRDLIKKGYKVVLLMGKGLPKLAAMISDPISNFGRISMGIAITVRRHVLQVESESVVDVDEVGGISSR